MEIAKKGTLYLSTNVECPFFTFFTQPFVIPASRTILPIVMAFNFTGFWRGTVTIRVPSVITMCLPCRAIRRPCFSSARTA